MNLPRTSSPIICHPAAERTDSKRLTLNGKRQTIHLCAYGWETRNSWGHTAYCPELGMEAKIRYYNRTWECHRFDSVISQLLYKVRMTDGKFAAKEREKSRLWKKWAKETNGGDTLSYKDWEKRHLRAKRKSRRAKSR